MQLNVCWKLDAMWVETRLGTAVVTTQNNNIVSCHVDLSQVG